MLFFLPCPCASFLSLLVCLYMHVCRYTCIHAYIEGVWHVYMYRRWWHPIPVLLPGKSHGQRSLVGCSPWGRKESDTTEQLHFHVSLSCIGEGNGNPLQCSCLENPRDGGAWWAAIYGIAQSQTWLKRFSSSSSSIQYSSKSDLIQKYLIQSHSLCKRETSHQVQTTWIWAQYDTCFWKLVLLSHIKK